MRATGKRPRPAVRMKRQREGKTVRVDFAEFSNLGYAFIAQAAACAPGRVERYSEWGRTC